MRNYIKLWFVALHYTYWFQDVIQTQGTFYVIGSDSQEATELGAADMQENIFLNSNLPPDYRFSIYAEPAAPKWFEMNKKNILHILNPNQIVDTEVFVDESPRETWSGGH